MLTVDINARFETQRTTGVQRYAAEVARRLGQRVAWVRPGRELHWGLGHAWEQFVLPSRLRPGTLLWSPVGTGPLSVRRQVITIHDVAVIEHPEWYGRAFGSWYRWLLPRLASRVLGVLTDSSFSKERIVETLDVDPGRVFVVPCGVDGWWFDAEPSEDVRARYGLAGDYVLTVSSLSPRKNFERLFRAWDSLAPKCEGVSLAVVGASSHPFARGKGFKVPPKHVRFLGYVPDRDLRALYRGALAFAYVSLYEGFGLPILEAMAAGAPVVAANVTSMPEVAGDAASLVNPLDLDAIGEAILHLIDSASLREDLRVRGRARASEFSWDRSAEGTWQVLRDFARHQGEDRP